MVRYRLLLVNALLLFALCASLWGRHIENAQPTPTDFLRGLPLPYRNWKAVELSVPPGELALLQPDSTLARRYESASGETLELTVIAGHRKRTVHLPAYCMTGSGWDTLSQQDVTLPLAGKSTIPAARVSHGPARSANSRHLLFHRRRFQHPQPDRISGAAVGSPFPRPSCSGRTRPPDYAPRNRPRRPVPRRPPDRCVCRRCPAHPAGTLPFRSPCRTLRHKKAQEKSFSRALSDC